MNKCKGFTIIEAFAVCFVCFLIFLAISGVTNKWKEDRTNQGLNWTQENRNNCK